MKQFILFLVFPVATYGQTKNDLFGLKIGYCSTNIVFKEAIEPSINIFGTIFNTGNTFVGNGPEFGVNRFIAKRIFLDLSFSTFSGEDIKAKVSNNENWYILKGLQIPLTVNYLLRDSTKRLRINIGSGIQYFKGHLKQYETISNGSGQVTNQINDINVSELQFSVRPGIQFRIIPNLFTEFIVKVSISTTGRYSDNPCLSLKYNFRNKK